MLPRSEIERRLLALRALLRKHSLDGALILSPLNIFYFTGTFVTGHLLVTEREVRLWVFRPLSRAREETFLPVEPLRSLRKLPTVLKPFSLRTLGFEVEALSPRKFERYREILADYKLQDISSLLLTLRMYKSPYEVACLREAGRLLAEALSEALPALRLGMTELEVLGHIELALRRRGHPGFVRSCRGHEFATGLVVSGPEAVTPSFMIAGEGGVGVLGFASGASSKEILPGEPILLDFSGFYGGYYVDQSRVFCWEDISPEVREFWDISERIMLATERQLRPGISAEEVFFAALREAEALGVAPYFMAHGEEGVSFVGHGVGLCIDEEPAIAPGVKTILEPGMVIALEPKLHIPGVGVIGLEDTFYLNESNVEKLTVYNRKLRVLRSNLS